ncbi:Short-chain dehydrogenase reductase SDR [Fusarium albosuccineum]|uniref:Short-chain dehydrogenase reductase SDR n=1 Tax=Fusarium albosuccineum TaxID=1237068 RepID=A0A8H4L9E0_9HYPO|nr:Short-chain dehydrogenase reductase SDR [Fusarium albosuccineum]
MNFSGKVALVTGAAGGLGKAVAKAFLNAGGRVAICDINVDRLSATTTEFQSAYSKEQVVSVVADITNRDEITRVFETTIQSFNRLDALVNNAGIVDKYDPVGTLSESLWDKVVAVNLTAPVLFSKLAVNQFLQQQPSGGTIINISSVAAIKGYAAGAAYTATKHGVVSLTKNTAAFYNKQGIHAVAILPGGMDTPIKETLVGLNEQGWQLTQKMSAATEPNLSDVDDVAQTILFFASDKGKNSNGALITVDGGWMAF